MELKEATNILEEIHSTRVDYMLLSMPNAIEAEVSHIIWSVVFLIIWLFEVKGGETM